ncbi:MAG TPA: hypothetical protein VMI56_22690 [Reyranella sp.]|nr:hypothetical protein [Reyranella sp.]
MRAAALILMTIGLLLPAMAGAQERTPKTGWAGGYRGLTQEDMNFYCFWNGNLFSVGASFCYRQDSSTTCTESPGKRPTWVTKNNDKLCEKNPSAMPF